MATMYYPRSRFLSLAVLNLCVCVTRAADVTWVPNSNGNWMDAESWSSNPNLPGEDDAVTIGGSIDTAVTVTHTQGDDTIQSLTLKYSDGLNITGGSLNILQDLLLDTSAILTVDGVNFDPDLTGVVDISRGRIRALNGGQVTIDVPTVIANDPNANPLAGLESRGLGSQLLAPGISSLSGINIQ